MLFRAERRHPCHRLSAVQTHAVMLNALQLLKRPLGRVAHISRLKAATHHPMQDQRHEADRRVRADPLGQTVIHRADLDLGLEHLETALDIGERFVALNHVLRGKPLGVGHQQQLAVHHFGKTLRLVVDVVAEQLLSQIHLDDARQVRFADRMVEARLGAAVRELATPVLHAFVLIGKLARPLIRLPGQRVDTLVALLGLLGCGHRIVCDHQPQVIPGLLRDHFLSGGDALLFVEGGEQIDELVVTPAWYRDDELERLATGQAHGLQGFEIVQAEQPPVGYQHQALHRREALKHLAERGQQGTRLGRVAVEHLVVDRQSFGGLNHAEHELAGNQPLLGHAVLAHVADLFAEPFATDRGEVVEDHRKILIDQRAQQPSDHAIDLILVIHQGIETAQQLLVGDRLRPEIGQRNRLHPAQHAELGLGVAQAVEHHQADQRFHVRGAAGAAEHPAQPGEAQRLPQLGQRPHIAERARGFERHRWRRRLGAHRFPTGDLEQAIDDRIERPIDLLGTAERGDGALLYLSGFVAIGLDELDVAAASGGGELDMHAATLSTYRVPSSLDNTVTNVPPQSFFDHGFETRAGAGGTFRKGVKIGGKCRTPVRRFGLEATVRPSLAFYNTCQEVDHLVATLKRLKGGRSTTVFG